MLLKKRFSLGTQLYRYTNVYLKEYTLTQKEYYYYREEEEEEEKKGEERGRRPQKSVPKNDFERRRREESVSFALLSSRFLFPKTSSWSSFSFCSRFSNETKYYYAVFDISPMFCLA